MKKRILLITLIGLSLGINAQTLTEKQRQNARATGYSIIASRNPNIDFSVYIIPWDGINTLEYNANNQINNSWHAQAVIKGNYFNQGFDGDDFSKYSTVLLSQAKFDQYKNTGTQWWIVCSTLPPFSEKANFNGNVGIGTSTPKTTLQLYKQNTLSRTSVQDMIYLSSSHSSVGYDGFGTAIVDFRRTYKNSTPHAVNRISFIERGHSTADKGGAITFATKELSSGSVAPKERLRIDYNGNVGIGTTDPGIWKLAINGKIRAKEIKVETGWSDFVFYENYELPTLKEVENHIKEKGHLKDIPSAKEVENNGIFLGQMDSKLLQKIEELTLYTIAQDKEIKELKKQNSRIEKLEKENEVLKSLLERVSKLEKEIKNKN